MNAYKCDRCGRLYEPYCKNQDYEWRGNNISIMSRKNAFEDFISYDLCPVCAKALVNFMAKYEDVELCSEGKD